MNILLYVYELLQNQKNVSLVGFGTFCKVKSPGRYDFEQMCFVPPTYALEFVSSLADDNGLIDYIAQKKNVSAGTVDYFVTKFVTELKTSIGEQEVNLPPLGKIKEVNGVLVFSPATDLYFDADFFGLPTFKGVPNQIAIEKKTPVVEEIPKYVAPIIVKLEDVVGKLNQEEIVKQQDTEAKRAETEQVSEKIVEEDNIVEQEAEQEPEPPKRILNQEEQDRIIAEETFDALEDRKHNILTWIIVTILFIATSMTIYNFYLVEYKPKAIARKHHKQEVQDSLHIDSLMKDSVKRLVFKLDTTKVDSSAKKNLSGNTLEKDTATVKPAGATVTYEIIAVAAKTEKAAERFVTKYKKLGYDAKIIAGKTPKDYRSISVGTFSTRSQAEEALKETQKKLKNKSIYIYSNIQK